MNFVLECNEQQFDENLSKMNDKALLGTIAVIQREMEKRQQQFDVVSRRLSEMTPVSADSPAAANDAELSTQLETLNSTLTMLMNRNKKCFARKMHNSKLKKSEASSIDDSSNNHSTFSHPTNFEPSSNETPAQTGPPLYKSTFKFNSVSSPATGDATTHPSSKQNPDTSSTSTHTSCSAPVQKPTIINNNHISNFVLGVNNNNNIKQIERSAMTTDQIAAKHYSDASVRDDLKPFLDISLDNATINIKPRSHDASVSMSDVTAGNHGNSAADSGVDDSSRSIGSLINRFNADSSGAAVTRAYTRSMPKLNHHSSLTMSDGGAAGERGGKADLHVSSHRITLSASSTPDKEATKADDGYSEGRSSVDEPDTRTNDSERSVSNHNSSQPIVDGEDSEDHSTATFDKSSVGSWNPNKVLKELYEITRSTSDIDDEAHSFINKEGYLEKLPMNKKKATLLKTWKRRYFKAHQGSLYYHEDDTDKPTGSILLIGGSYTELGPCTLGIDDGRGHYLVVKCPSEQEFMEWKRSLTTQIVGNIRAQYVTPSPSCPTSSRDILVVDLGACSVRAGILCKAATLPKLFFPCIVAINKSSGEQFYGFDALKPINRMNCRLCRPVRTTVKVEKDGTVRPLNVDMDVIPGMFKYIFDQLDIKSSNFKVMLSTPSNLGDRFRQNMMNMLIKDFHCEGVNIVNQTMLSLYSYSATSGIMVDVGERVDIVPITDGYIVEGGVTHQPYGGEKITESLNYCLSQNKYRFYTEVESYLVRLTKERTCYVSGDYQNDLRNCDKNPKAYQSNIDLSELDFPYSNHSVITNDVGRFKSAEGLFDNDMWGLDNPTLHKLVYKAVQCCPMDTRREMWRSIFLSGGVTMLPGFAERLTSELNKMVPPSITVQVHSSPFRYHSAFIGACTLANLPEFSNAIISAEEWLKNGPSCLKKWSC